MMGDVLANLYVNIGGDVVFFWVGLIVPTEEDGVMGSAMWAA